MIKELNKIEVKGLQTAYYKVVRIDDNEIRQLYLIRTTGDASAPFTVLRITDEQRRKLVAGDIDPDDLTQNYGNEENN